MSGASAALFGFAAMLVLIALRMPVGLSLIVVGGAGFVYLADFTTLLAYLKTTTYYQFSGYTLSVIPLFILMGALAEKSGIAATLFNAARAFLGHLRGGLAMAVIGACTVFGAICGSSVATTATFGRAALPELERDGFNMGFATGTVAVGGTLGILVPPSVILVVYAISTEQNIAKLFMAAMVPGLLAALFYCITILIVATWRPQVAPALPRRAPGSGRRALLAAWPAMVVMLIVIGGIYGGVFTPTEAAAVGTIAMLVMGLVQGRLSRSDIWQSLVQTAETTGMIFLILLGSEIFNAFLARSQMPDAAATFVGNLGLAPLLVVAGLLAFYILLGAVMDELAMILLTLPIFFPIVMALDLGMFPDDVAIWFGILVLVVVGIGLTAPPIGLNVFVVSAIAKKVPITATYRGVLPFLAADILRLALLVAFPGLSLYLVHLLS